MLLNNDKILVTQNTITTKVHKKVFNDKQLYEI